MAKKIGLDCVAYLHAGALTTTTWSDTGWSVIEHVKDVTLGLEKGETDLSDRANDGWESIRGTIKRGSIDISMTWDDTDTDLDAFRDGFLNDTDVAVALLSDSLANDGQGLFSNFQVLKFERTESLEEGVMANITIKPVSMTAWKNPAS